MLNYFRISPTEELSVTKFHEWLKSYKIPHCVKVRYLEHHNRHRWLPHSNVYPTNM